MFLRQIVTNEVELSQLVYTLSVHLYSIKIVSEVKVIYRQSIPIQYQECFISKGYLVVLDSCLKKALCSLYPKNSSVQSL